MGQSYPIHQVSKQLGVTSRTLRHWEDKGLFISQREPQSGRRIYNDESLQKIRLSLLFRELDIPLKDVKTVLDSGDSKIASKIIEKQISKLNEETNAIFKRKAMLNRCLLVLNSMKILPDASKGLMEMEKTLALELLTKQNLIEQCGDSIMTNDTITSRELKIISLPAMRAAVCNVVSSSPEGEALDKVLSWAESENLMGTARIFGFNTTKYYPGINEYGWAASITVPEQVTIPEYLEEKRLAGGLYAALDSTNEINDSWKKLTRLVKESDGYEVDKSRLCLEEHICRGEPRGQGNDFYLTLLEPVIRDS